MAYVAAKDDIVNRKYFSRIPFICTRPCTTDGCTGVQYLRSTEDICGRSTGNVWVCPLCKKIEEEEK